MDRVLYCWIGTADLRAPSGKGDAEAVGPIGRAVGSMEFSKIYLLSDQNEEVTSGYVAWLRGMTHASVTVCFRALSSPMNFSEIYNATVSALEEHPCGDGERRVFHISPGTSAMAAIWIILAKTSHPAELIQSSVAHGVEVVDVPFDLAADYLPPIAFSGDSEITRVSSGLPPAAPEFAEIAHSCEAMRKLVERARIVAVHDIPVLVKGESGTGKELLARAIHASSPRRGKPFVAVNCGAIPDNLFEAEFFGHAKGAFTGAHKERGGYFEEASGGTLFLDEVGELSLASQVKLLRVLEEGKVTRVGEKTERKVDARIVSATNRALIEEVGRGNFRGDLFHRLAIGVLDVPPLRKRGGDVKLLLDKFLGESNRKFGASMPGAWIDRKLSVGARKALAEHSWPGNVRELRNTVARMVLWASSDTISEEEARDAIFSETTTPASRETTVNLEGALAELSTRKAPFDLRAALDAVAKEFIDEALSAANGNKSAAAKLLGMKNYQTLDNWRRRKT